MPAMPHAHHVPTPQQTSSPSLDRRTDAFPARLCVLIFVLYMARKFTTDAWRSFPHAFWLKSHQGQKVRGFIEWLAPKYAPDSNPHQWHQTAVELASLEDQNAHPTFLFYTFGEQSKHITITLARLTTQEVRTEFLKTFSHPYYSRLPNYCAASQECQPVEFSTTEWSNDELAGFGSYCNFQVGLEHGDEDVETMREGLPDQRVWFAGEHTAPFIALGTATGAYWSGEMVGKRISEAYSMKKRH